METTARNENAKEVVRMDGVCRHYTVGGETVKALSAGERCVVVTYPEALAEKVVAPKVLGDSTLRVCRGQQMEMDSLIDRLQELGFVQRQ